MTWRNWSLCLILAVSLCLSGCNRSTVVVLPPQTEDPTQNLLAGEGTSATAVPTTEAQTKPSSSLETEPTDPSETQSSQTEPTLPAATEKSQTTTLPPTTKPPETTEFPVETTPPETTSPSDPTEPSGYRPGSMEYAILAELNTYRQDNGLGALSLSQTLCGIAYVRGQECAQTGSRLRPDGTAGITILGEYGLFYGSAGEIVTVCSADSAAADVVTRWLGNEEARNTLLSPAYNTVGIGVYTIDGIRYIACLLVG